MEEPNVNPFSTDYADGCIQDTDCNLNNLQPTFQAVLSARENMCDIDNCPGFVTNALHTVGRLYNKVTNGIVARNHLDMQLLCDASIGVENSSKGWRAEAYINNLTDERAQLHINRQDFFERVTLFVISVAQHRTAEYHATTLKRRLCRGFVRDR